MAYPSNDVLTEVLITVHAGGEELIGSWLLVVVEWFSLHDDVLTKILVSVHAGSEELVIWDAGKTSSRDSRLRASAELEESSSSSNSLVVGENFLGGWAVWRLLVLKRDSRYIAEEGGNSEFHYELII